MVHLLGADGLIADGMTLGNTNAPPKRIYAGSSKEKVPATTGRA